MQQRGSGPYEMLSTGPVSQKNSDISYRSCRRSLAEFDVLAHEPLGQGAFGKVVLVRDKSDGITYAMKIVKKINRTEAFINNVRQEVRIHKYLNHPYVTRLYYFIEDHDNVYLILSYAEFGMFIN